MAVFGNSRPQFTDKNGDPISGGKLFIGLPNQDPIANPAAITDLNDVPISNPVTLDANGVPAQAIKLDAEFSQAVFDRNNVEVTSYQIARTSGFLLYSELTGLSGQGGEWNILTTYGKNNFVKGSDGNFYISLTDGNLGNDPVSVSTSWSEFAWPTIYNPSEIYNTGDTCIGSDVKLYSSAVDANQGNNPVTDGGINWATAPESEFIAGDGIDITTLGYDVTISAEAASLSNAGITALVDSVASTSTTDAATPKAVKAAYDKAVDGVADAASALDVANAALGGSQTWTSVTRDRNINYTNSTGKPIEFAIYFITVSNNTTGKIRMTVGGAGPMVIAAAGGSAVNQCSGNGSIVIPAGASYSYSTSNINFASIETWELR